jgi:hypothetical protein
MSVEAGTVVDEQVAPPAVADKAPTDIAQPPAPAAPSPAAGVEEPREPRPETVRLATFNDFRGKRKRVDDYVFDLEKKDGTKEKVRVHLEALDGPTYDKLIGDCTPTREQAARNMQANPDTFEPLLLSRVITEPRMAKEQWAEIREMEEWSGGEWASLVLRAQALCMQGLDVPFSGRG